MLGDAPLPAGAIETATRAVPMWPRPRASVYPLLGANVVRGFPNYNRTTNDKKTSLTVREIRDLLIGPT